MRKDAAAMELDCVVQCYEWGKRGERSEVGRLKRASDASFHLSEALPYAELWMGTHPSGPAKVKASGQLLGDFIAESGAEGRDVVGTVPPAYAAKKSDLPFMFKVLSINTALSIQAHPDKALAERLHATFPDIYKDGNHKPEMAIALTAFEALSGFRTVKEIQTHMREYSELEAIVGKGVADKFQQFRDSGSDISSVQANLKTVFSAFMMCPDETTDEQIGILVARLGALHAAGAADKVMQLILRLNSDYPRDRGVLCPLLFNYLELAEGQASIPSLHRRAASNTRLSPPLPTLSRRASSWAPTSRMRTSPATASSAWPSATTWCAPGSRPRCETSPRWWTCSPTPAAARTCWGL